MDRIRVVGAGYVGLVTAVGLVQLGRRVELIESREDRRSTIATGRVPIFEEGVAEVLAPAVSSGAIVVCAEPAGHPADLVLICVGTPILDDGSSDLSQLVGALESARPAFQDGAAVVIRSTTPIGGARRLTDELDLPPTQLFLNPEFLRQGTALEDFLSPARTVIGSHPEAAETLRARVEEVLASTGAPLLRVSFEEAELIKNSANAFLALKLSFVNELALLSEAYGGDIERVVAGLALDPRIGGSYMRSSYGFGGSCLPKELRTLAAAGWDRGLSMHVTAAAAAANTSTQAHFATRIGEAVGGLEGRTVALLGLAFKAGTDDIRESPALAVARVLHAGGAVVRGYDPEAAGNARAAAPWLDVCATAEDAIAGADVAVIATEWPEFAALSWDRLQAVMRRPLVIDGRRLLDARKMRDLGFEYEAVGSGDIAR